MADIRLVIIGELPRKSLPTAAHLRPENRVKICNFFLSTDIVGAYYQIPMSADDIHQTTITTIFGLCKFFRMPFHLLNSAGTFRRLIDDIFRGIKFVHSYFDDC